jgi:hypothetical protein
MAELTVNVSAGDDDAHDNFPPAFKVFIVAGDDDAWDGFSAGEEGPQPYAFIM